MRKFIKKHKTKLVMLFLMLISGIINVSASYIFASDQVSYDNTDSGISSDNVQDAIDELYGIARISQRMDVLEAALDSKVGIDEVYPVGSIYISRNSENPSSTFGGTWEAFGSGKTLVSVDTSDTSFDTVEETGGAKTVSYTPAGSVGNTTLNVNQIPSHDHSIPSLSGTAASAGAHIHNLGYKCDVNAGSNRCTIGGGSSRVYTANNVIDSAGAHTHSVTTNASTTGAKGGGGAHNHGFTGTAASISTLQPYITVYMWKRTA